MGTEICYMSVPSSSLHLTRYVSAKTGLPVYWNEVQAFLNYG